MAPISPRRRAEIRARQDAEDQQAAAAPPPTAGSPTRPGHNEATGRSREPVTGVRRGSLIPLDRSRIGYLPMTPANRPELFTRGQDVGIPAPAIAAGVGAAGRRGMAQQADEEESDSDDGGQLPFQMRPVPWVVGPSPPQPLTFDLPTAAGGVERRQLQFTVDFTDEFDVKPNGDECDHEDGEDNPNTVLRPTHLELTMRLFALPTALLAYLALPDLSHATHTSNWAVLVSTSRFWFNYRHMANTLSLYRTVKRLGIPDSQIILMLPDDMACNPRNTFAGSVFNDKGRGLDLYDQKKDISPEEEAGGEGGETVGQGMPAGIEVDYRGNEVTVESFIRLLTDRWPASHPTSKRLMTDDRSNILIYMTGHGGDSFLKFQDAEEISSHDLADAFEQMYEKKRYHELLFIIDTCQANTMYTEFYSPGIVATGSSAKDQSSYSHHADQDVGVAVIDRWTYYNLDFLETRLNSTASDVRLGELFDFYTFDRVHSDAGVRYDLFPGGEHEARNRRVLDFFGNVQGVDVETAGDGQAALGDWRADLEALRRIAERQAAEERNATQKPADVGIREQREVEKTVLPAAGLNMGRDMTSLTGGEGWVKKVVGAASLLVLGGAWLAGGKIR
ncbi:glycosylphosphatidylinositol anchor biosynthesis [Elasticomyces elasticus]|nr:glycosylphosphatidylinositol anchor biosynthesis [Elasticomyces elasticus]